MTYWYAYGYKTKERAETALEESFAEGVIFEGEAPEIRSYSIADETGVSRTRWGIKLHD